MSSENTSHSAKRASMSFGVSPPPEGRRLKLIEAKKNLLICSPSVSLVFGASQNLLRGSIGSSVVSFLMQLASLDSGSAPAGERGSASVF